MRPCPQCGALAQDTDDFCGNCGTYLGWDAGESDRRSEGRRKPATQPETPERPTDETDAAPTTSDPQEPPHGTSGPAPAGTPEPSSPTLAPPMPSHRSPEPAAPAPATGGQRPADESPDQPIAVQPAKPIARRRRTNAAPEQATPDGPPCPACGTPNPVGRRFCRRCAAPLDPTPEHATLPWWRRIRLPRRHRTSRSPYVRRIVLLLVLAGLVVAGFLLYPLGNDAVQAVRDKLATPKPRDAAHVTATAAVPGHPASAATDGLTNRYWGAPAPGAAVEFSFAHPFRLLSVVVHSGSSTEREGFDRQARPQQLQLVVTDSEGHTRTVDIDLADQPGPQRTDTGISDVVRVRIVVRSAYALRPSRHIALGEVEFFGR